MRDPTTIFRLFFSQYSPYRKYLSDPTEDVRVATENLLADFLREIRDVTVVSRQLDQYTMRTAVEFTRRADATLEKLPDLTLENAERALFIPENDDQSHQGSESALKEDSSPEINDRDTGGN